MNVASPFKVETIETCQAPRRIGEGKWCRYVLTNHQSQIVGRFRGTLAQTRRNAENLADRLNGRARTGNSPWAQQARKRNSNKKT